MTNEQKAALVGKTVYKGSRGEVVTHNIVEVRKRQSWRNVVDLYNDRGERVQPEDLFDTPREALEHMREIYEADVRMSEAQVRDVQADLDCERMLLKKVRDHIDAIDKAANFAEIDRLRAPTSYERGLVLDACADEPEGAK